MFKNRPTSHADANRTGQLHRRTWLYLCAATGTSLLAGCTGTDPPDDEQPDDTSNGPPDDAEEPIDDAEEPIDDGEAAVTVDPSADSITYGEEYTVTATIRNTADEAQYFGGSVVARVNTSAWRPLVEGDLLTIAPGDEITETYSLSPPATGSIEFGYTSWYTQEHLARWELSVDVSRGTFGEEHRFYDGLAITADLEAHESIEMPIQDSSEEGVDSRMITAPDGRSWIRVLLRIENTNESGAVSFRHIRQPEFYLTSEGIQQPQYDRRIAWSDSEFEDQLPQYESVRIDQMADYFAPPTQIAPGAAYEGWLLFSVPDDAEMDGLELSLIRQEPSSWDDISVYWDGT